MKLVIEHDGSCLMPLWELDPGDCFFFPNKPKTVWMATAEGDRQTTACVCLTSWVGPMQDDSAQVGEFRDLDRKSIIDIVGATLTIKRKKK